jgi:predicted site-specific integrase-resolvase
MAMVVRRNPTEPVKDGWLTLPQAAKLLGIARHTLLSRALDGEIETQVIAGRRVVSRTSVEAALMRQNEAETPPTQS